MGRYVKRFLVSIDQLVNTLLGGDEDETISSRMGKRVNTCPICSFLCRLLDLLDNDHCRKSIEEDEGNDHRK